MVVDWQDFLKEQADKYCLSEEEKETLLKRFPEKERYLKNEAQFTQVLNEGISDKKYQIGQEAVTKRMQEIYKKFAKDCPALQNKSRGKLLILYQFLLDLYEKSKTRKRCILGLKGNYQEAQQELAAITKSLQKLLKDDSLSITVEEGSIIIIVESSQTGYEQIKKRLIGREIAGFSVEYVIDEWQDVCRRMLKKQTHLSSNSLLKAQFNRNLIEEELFIDLALVKPKPQRHEQHKDDLNPDRSSEFYTRQEVEKRFAYQEFLDEVISKRTEKNLAIIGEPGAGKTTLLQKLAFWLLQETDDLVIWIPLRNLGGQRLSDYLPQIWLKDALMFAREEIKADWEQKFKGGGVWLLLDGLDEMSETARQSLSLQGWVTQAQLIISCRLNLWQANPTQLQGFQTYLTQPFQDEQMQQFVQRWFGGVSGEGEKVTLAESLWEGLQAPGKERIKDLCRNPLRLTLLSSIWQGRQGDLPDTTAKLYEKFVNYIYDWKKEAFPVTEAEKQHLNAGLGELAKASLDGEGTRFRLTHRLVCASLGKRGDNSLLDTALRLGWLNEVGVDADEPEDPVYAFYHATFQEYFAALAVADWDYFLPKDHVDCPVEGKKYRIFAPQWKQVILLWLGQDIGNEKKEEFIRALVEFEDGFTELEHHNGRGFYEHQAYFLAAAGINEFKACSLVTEIVRQVVKWGFNDFNIEKQEWQIFLDQIKEAARKAIPETIRPLAISALIDILDHCPNEYTRRQAAESLGEIDPGNPEAIAGLVKVIATTHSEYTRRQAASILGEIDPGNPEAIAALVNLIASTEDESTRSQAAYNLGEIDPGNPEAIAALVNVIASTEDRATRRQAVWSLEKIGQGNPEAIAGLVKVIASTESEDTRRKAAYSLGEILTTPQQYAGVVSALKDNLSDEVYQNNFDRFDKCYKVVWNCAENLLYPEFYQAWHHPPTTPHPEVTEQTPVGHNSTVDSLETQLQNLPIFCLNAQILATETRESEIAQILCELIWEKALPNELYPEVTTLAQLRRSLKQLKLTLNLPKLNLLLTECEHPTPELIAFCHKLTDTVAISWLTEEPLEAPLKGFPPNQPNLISAIETWLEEM